MARIGKTSAQRNLNDVFEIQFNFIGSQRVSESIERLPQPGFKIFENGDDFLDSLLVDHAVWSVDEQTNVFVELNVWSQFHRSPGLSHKPAARTRNFVRSAPCRLILFWSRLQPASTFEA